ncbi:putative Calreticulin precursor [Corchorus olitorius]|uniref:Calreticulin n=1 Tax=Corchorus olitorius TaxID=93759 RepID=A0A1R3KX49_9ROSI|nr:putative Calreticulin precursor [Corchorus olitorius]
MSATDDSQVLSRTISIGVESPPSREEGDTPEIPLIRKRKATGVAEASSRPKVARLDAFDPIFSDPSHVGDVIRPSPSTVGVASTSEAGTNTLQPNVCVASGSTAGSSGSVERNWVRRYNERVDRAFSAAVSMQSKYLKGAGNSNKDLENMETKVIAERRAKQNARRAGLVASTSPVVPFPSSVSKAPETPQANPPLTLAQACP